MSLCCSTLGSSAIFTGKTLHSGSEATVKLLPASPGSGIRFVLPSHASSSGHQSSRTVSINPALVTSTRRSIEVEFQPGYRIATVEHLLSVLSGMQISDCLVEVLGNEVPIGDGSGLPFVELIGLTGTEWSDTIVQEWIPSTTYEFTSSNGAYYRVEPSARRSWSISADFRRFNLGVQTFDWSPSDGKYDIEIAPSRTFCFASEIIPLLRQRLIRGGDLQNAVVLADNRRIDDDALRYLGSLGFEYVGRNVEIGEPIVGGPLRFENEPIRHKLLDLIGDLALLNRPVRAHIHAERAGHLSNIEFASYLTSIINSTT